MPGRNVFSYFLSSLTYKFLWTLFKPSRWGEREIENRNTREKEREREKGKKVAVNVRHLSAVVEL